MTTNQAISMSEKDSPFRSFSFLHSPWTWLCVGLRLLVIGIMSSKNAIGEFDFATAPWWPSLQAAVVRPDTTLASIQAQCSLGPILSRSSLSIDTYCRWWLSDRSSSTASTSTIPIVLVVLLMIGIDLWVAHSIERIGQLCLAKEDMDQEKTIQQTLLPESIQPKYRHIFPITADSTTMAVLSQAQLPSVAALLYLLSPVPFLAGTVFASYQSIMYGLLLWAVRQSMEGPRTNPSEMALSLVMVATTMEPFIIIIAIPIYLSLRQQQQHRRDDDDGNSRMAQLFLVFLGLWAVVVVGFICYTTHPVEGQSWYGMFLDMAFPTFHRPNLGLQWYLQMQLFDRFRDYFAYMIRMLPYLLVLPITIRLYRYPLVLVSDTIKTVTRTTKRGMGGRKEGSTCQRAIGLDPGCYHVCVGVFVSEPLLTDRLTD